MSTIKKIGLMSLIFIFVLMVGTFNILAEDEITIKFQTSVYVEAPHQEALGRLAEVYEEKNPNVNIDIYGAPYAEFWDRLTTEILSGTEGDIVQFYTEHIPRYNDLKSEGAFVNLDDKIKGTELENQFMQEECIYNGNYLALSNYTWGILGIFYRKSMLEEANINPKDIETMDDFADAAEKLTTDEVYGFPIVLGSHPFVASEWYRMLARPVSGGIFFADGETGPYEADRVNTDNPANIWAAKYWQDLIFEREVTPKQNPDKLDAREYYWADRAAFMLDGPWFIGMTAAESEEILEDTGLIPMPKIEYEGETYQGGSNASTLVTALSKNAEHPEEAWKFMKWMATVEAQEIAATSGMIASNPELAETEEYADEYPLQSELVSFMGDYNIVNDPAIPEFGELSEIITDTAELMFIRQTDPEDALGEAAEEIKTIFE